MARRPHITAAQAHIAARLLVDECAITRPDYGSGALDPVTLALTDSGTTLFEGACFVNENTSADPGFVSIEAMGRVDRKVRVRLPIACPQLAQGDIITITASDTAGLVGVEYEVLDDSAGSFTVSKLVRARRRVRTA